MKKLLNIDGGGVRVYFSLLILKYIEKKTNKKITDIFDFYSGVSASAIILSGLLTKYSIDEMLNLFKDISYNIFYRSYYYTFTSGFGIFNSKYPESNINNELQKLLGEHKMNDIIKPLTLLSYDLHTNKPVYFQSYNNDISNNDLWKIVRGSASAPTYFSPFNLDDMTLIDGGVVTNNLSEIIFLNALDYFGKDEEFFQLSVGTGTYNYKFTQPPSGLWSWGGPIIDIFFLASSKYEMTALKNISKYENLKQFHRIDIELEEDITLDDCYAFDKMDLIFEIWLEKNKDYLDKICLEL